MADIPDIPGGKMGKGPFPTWMLLAAGGVLGFYLYERNKSSSVGTVPTSNAIDPYSQVGAGPGGWAYQPPSTPAGQTSIQSNQDWATAVEKALISMGYNPATVDNAVRTYLAGQQLDASGQTLIALALQLVGPPPQTLPPAPPAGNPPPISTTTSPTKYPTTPLPSLPANIMNLMTANGEHIVDAKPSTKGGYIFLTNKGGIYNVGGSAFYGSAYNQSKVGFGKLIPLANGGYEAIDLNGQSYVFGT